jgi:hypothetical protein
MSMHEYPGIVPFDTQTFDVRKVKSVAHLALEDLRQSAPQQRGTWVLDQAVFRARIDALRHMIREGMQPVGEADVSIIVSVQQRAVSDEAGPVGAIPESMHTIRTHRYEPTRW